MMQKYLGAIFTLPLLACAGGEVSADSFWQIGLRYEVTLVPNEKARLVPEVAQALGSLKDSVAGILTLDSIQADSLFGRLDISVGEIGLLEPMSSTAFPSFVGKVAEDSVWILLNSHVTDGGPWLTGESYRGRVEGEWIAARRTLTGRFRITPVKPP